MALIIYKVFSPSSEDSSYDKYSVIVLDLFDTRTEIDGYDTTEDQFNSDAAFIIEQLTYYNNLYDIYNSYDGINNMKTINENAGIKAIEVDEEIIEFLEFGKEIYYETNGKVNIAMGSVLSIWHTYRENGNANPESAALPSLEELEEAANHIDIENIIIDDENNTVYLADSEMSLDVGGIAKGYAVQCTVEAAKEQGIDHILLNVGGNISCIGTKSGDKNYNIGIQNPDTESEEAYIEAVEISNGQCVVSSGDYQRYYEVDGKRYCHIINPDTLFPADEFKQVSIVTNDSGRADAFSTAVFNMSLEEGQAFIAGLSGVEAMWVLQDGSVVYSDNFPL